MKKNKGFSLIELLISITIIGLLATIVLNGVSNSRARAYDSKIKQQLNSFRTAAEVYFTNQIPNSYGTANICTAGVFADLDPVNGAPGIFLKASNLPSFTQVYCGSNDSTYSVRATLFSGNQYWCVDSKGAAKLYSGTPIGGALCP